MKTRYDPQGQTRNSPTVYFHPKTESLIKSYQYIHLTCLGISQQYMYLRKDVKDAMSQHKQVALMVLTFLFQTLSRCQTCSANTLLPVLPLNNTSIHPCIYRLLLNKCVVSIWENITLERVWNSPNRPGKYLYHHHYRPNRDKPWVLITCILSPLPLCSWLHFMVLFQPLKY